MTDCAEPQTLASESDRISRARGCLLGQLAGDSLGGLVEFQSAETIRREYPDGVRQLADGGKWDTLAGQPTDDSEMALLLARMLVQRGTYDQSAAREQYVFWLDSRPFDCGTTIRGGLRDTPNHESQANGAMMRISPLGIFGVNYDLTQVAQWAILDAEITHPNLICRQANALFAMALSYAIQTGADARCVYESVVSWAGEMNVEPTLMDTILAAEKSPPPNYLSQQGWVLIAFQNALWQMLHAPNLEEGVVDTVMRGGDTDTNAAICGALLGAVYGDKCVPEQWVKCLLNCRPEQGKPGVSNSRPQCFWPVDALELAENLVKVSPQNR